MQNDELLRMLQGVADGLLPPETALQKLKHLDFEPVGDFAKIDRHRQLRTGFPEVVFGLGKTPEQIVAILRSLRESHPCIMATRISMETYSSIQASLREVRYFPSARICALGEPVERHSGTVTVIAAGTSDITVAQEAAVTAELAGFGVKRLWDVGVAGIHRLLEHRALLSAAEVIVVVAGMEGALPSVVGGLVNCPVIAVPTSIGYGASFQGLAALLAMLNSCAAGVGVVNIDNGFGAAILAGQILQLAYRQSNHTSP